MSDILIYGKLYEHGPDRGNNRQYDSQCNGKEKFFLVRRSVMKYPAQRPKIQYPAFLFRQNFLIKTTKLLIQPEDRGEKVMCKKLIT